jgi:hypothetical protein
MRVFRDKNRETAAAKNRNGGSGYVLFLCLAIGLLPSCGEPVNPLDGFTAREMNYLLSGAEGKAWTLILRSENGEPVQIAGCGGEEALLFLPGTPVQPLYYGIQPDVCSPSLFCDGKPWICSANELNCANEPEACAEFPEGVYWLGSWSVPPGPSADTRLNHFEIILGDQRLDVRVEYLTASRAEFRYVQNLDGRQTEVVEEYLYTAP